LFGETDWFRPTPAVSYDPDSIADEFAGGATRSRDGSPPARVAGADADARLREMDALLADLARKEEALRAAETPPPPPPPEPEPEPEPAATPSPEPSEGEVRWPYRGASPYLDIPAEELDGFTRFFSGPRRAPDGGPSAASPGSRAVDSGLRGAPFSLERAYNSARSPPQRKPRRRKRRELPPVDAPPALRARLERLPRDALLQVAEALLEYALGRAPRLPQPALGMVEALDKHLPPDPSPAEEKEDKENPNKTTLTKP